MIYREKLKAILTPQENRIFRGLDSPGKIQDYLDSLSINFELTGETYMSPRRLIKAKTAHCFEGALFAATALAWHGQKPLLMDLRTIPKEEDHVITLFRQNGLWGALSKTNHSILRYRDPIYKSVRELAMSYFHEYLLDDGRKSLRAFSAPFDLSKYPPEKWVTAGEDLYWLVEGLDDSRHFPIAPDKIMRKLRRASKTEVHAMNSTVDFKIPKKFKKY